MIINLLTSVMETQRARCLLTELVPFPAKLPLEVTGQVDKQEATH